MIRLILLIVIGVLALSFFGISVQELIEQPQTQANFAFIWALVQDAWAGVSDWLASMGVTIGSPTR